jgi:hypothetical protein
VHFDHTLPDKGELHIAYRHQNNSYGWGTFYNNTAQSIQQFVPNLDDHISSTSSVNPSTDRAVSFTFYYVETEEESRLCSERPWQGGV